MIKREWYIVDAKNKILGRLSSIVAQYLIGKHKVEYFPGIDVGDYVIVINAELICVSGRKFKNKVYYRHTGYVGGIKKFTFKQIISRYPEKVIEIAIKGMLPKNALGRMMYRRLKVYTGCKHNHTARAFQFLDDSNIINK